MTNQEFNSPPPGKMWIFRPYITRAGKRIYRPGGKMWALLVKK